MGSLLPAAVEPQPIVRARTDLRLFLMLHQGERRFFHALKVKFRVKGCCLWYFETGFGLT